MNYGIYIHIPFCVRKCAYCDFVSYADAEGRTDGYIDALEREMRLHSGKKADTIFIGGGTPSVLRAEQITRVAELVFKYFDVQKNYEFTMETNPGTLDEHKIKSMQRGGINRVSVGVQSFNDGELNKIGRIHDSETAYKTVLELKRAGFDNISIDLMTALPDQTMSSLKSTLCTAVSLPVTHISAYSLIIEDNTPLERAYSRGELILPDEETDREMYAYVTDFLAENGFARYEISNFARDTFECRHNIKYWTMKPYIGIGAAAHSFTGDERLYNTPDLNGYLSGAKQDKIQLTKKDKISEFIITGLRMTKGISAADFKSCFGEEIEDIYGFELMKFMSLGLLKKDGERYSLTRRGIDVSNSVLCEFV